jgi:SAM-dependent methyltransferase
MSVVKRALLIGCGYSRAKVLAPDGNSDWGELTTLDCNPECEPDLLCDLERVPWTAVNVSQHTSLPDSNFDEVHAYEVLEHLGSQGDAQAFFRHFAEIWRVLKPDGFLCATTPSRYSPWLWGDPGHKRVILPQSLTFLDQTQYTAQVGVTMMSDYRNMYRADFKIIQAQDDKVFNRIVLQAVKPSRIKQK